MTSNTKLAFCFCFPEVILDDTSKASYRLAYNNITKTDIVFWAGSTPPPVPTTKPNPERLIDGKVDSIWLATLAADTEPVDPEVRVARTILCEPILPSV